MIVLAVAAWAAAALASGASAEPVSKGSRKMRDGPLSGRRVRVQPLPQAPEVPEGDLAESPAMMVEPSNSPLVPAESQVELDHSPPPPPDAPSPMVAPVQTPDVGDPESESPEPTGPPPSPVYPIARGGAGMKGEDLEVYTYKDPSGTINFTNRPEKVPDHLKVKLERYPLFEEEPRR